MNGIKKIRHPEVPRAARPRRTQEADSAIPVLGSGLLPGRELCSPLKRGEDFAEAADRGKRPLLRQAGPLAAQDEMIDPQDFAVTRDLLLDRHLVADDEAVARELLERRRAIIGAAAFETPRGVGVVFEFERTAAFFVR